MMDTCIQRRHLYYFYYYYYCWLRHLDDMKNRGSIRENRLFIALPLHTPEFHTAGKDIGNTIIVVCHWVYYWVYSGFMAVAYTVAIIGITAKSSENIEPG